MVSISVASKEDIARLLAEAGKTDRAARDSLAQLAQAGALLYVGEQLQRIADMMASGFWVNPGDFGGYSAGPQERS